MSVIVGIADAVVAELNSAPAGTFAQAFEAVRAYVPVYDLAEMKDLHVTVVPKSIESQQTGRAMVQQDVQIDVAVQKKIGSDSDVDGLMALTEQVADYLRAKRPAALPGAICVRIENVPVYSAEHLGELRQFTSVLTLTYRVAR